MGYFEYTVLQVRDGNNADSPLLEKYCGTVVPSRVQSTRNNLYVKFRTSSLTSLGFRAEYWPLDTGKDFFVISCVVLGLPKFSCTLKTAGQQVL